MKEYTTEQVELWLGSSNTLGEAIDVIKEIVNGSYSVKSLQSDFIESEV